MSTPNGQFPRQATIASGQSLSDAVSVGGRGATIVGIILDPDGWTAAALTFQASLTGEDGTWHELTTTAGNAVTISTPTENTWVPITPADFAGVPYLKVRSGTVGSPVNQGAERVITLVSRNV